MFIIIMYIISGVYVATKMALDTKKKSIMNILQRNIGKFSCV